MQHHSATFCSLSHAPPAKSTVSDNIDTHRCSSVAAELFLRFVTT
jgi:hypothetical protein